MTVKAPGARNKKVARLVARFSPEIERRIEAVADKMGQNKGTTLAILAAQGLVIFEQNLGIVPVVADREEARKRITDTLEEAFSSQS